MPKTMSLRFSSKRRGTIMGDKVKYVCEKYIMDRVNFLNSMHAGLYSK